MSSSANAFPRAGAKLSAAAAPCAVRRRITGTGAGRLRDSLRLWAAAAAAQSARRRRLRSDSDADSDSTPFDYRRQRRWLLPSNTVTALPSLASVARSCNRESPSVVLRRSVLLLLLRSVRRAHWFMRSLGHTRRRRRYQQPAVQIQDDDGQAEQSRTERAVSQ